MGESDPVLSVVTWGTALCASVLVHALLGAIDGPVEITREEVRIEVVSTKDALELKSSLQASASVDGAQNETQDTPERVQERASGEVKPAKVAAPSKAGLFRVGAKRPSLYERNRAYAARQTALEPLRAKLKEAEAAARVETIDPAATYRCGGAEVDKTIQTEERDVGHWAPFVPRQLLPEKFAEGLSQVLVRAGRHVTTSTYVEVVFPATGLVVELEEPAGALLSIGLSHARCVVGLSHAPLGFPITWKGMPMRLATKDGDIVAAVVDATLHEDATFLLRSVDGTRLPFRTGRVRHGDRISSRLTALSALARLLR